jgi:hypothetical protein
MHLALTSAQSANLPGFRFLESDIIFNIIMIMRTESVVQAERDNNRSQSVPSGDGPSRRRKAPTTKKSQRSLDQDDMFNALVKLQSRSEEIFGKKQT